MFWRKIGFSYRYSFGAWVPLTTSPNSNHKSSIKLLKPVHQETSKLSPSQLLMFLIWTHRLHNRFEDHKTWKQTLQLQAVLQVLQCSPSDGQSLQKFYLVKSRATLPLFLLSSIYLFCRIPTFAISIPYCLNIDCLCHLSIATYPSESTHLLPY